MKALFDSLSEEVSKLTTRKYSTSFSIGIYFLDKKFHIPIYGIYGFVRLADEIVDSFHGYKQKALLQEIRENTFQAIEEKISINPILNSFQHAVNVYKIDLELIDIFLNSMEMDLKQKTHDINSYQEYILGSAEVVGLMCLKTFSEGNDSLYKELKPYAKRLGAAFQKINFLRDLNMDFHTLGRSYFPKIELQNFNDQQKLLIEKEIYEDFKQGLEGIRRLPNGARLGVYVAYVYFYALFQKIRATSSERIMRSRIRISNQRKIGLLIHSYLRFSFNKL
ncbi:phytoene/squalene synthase family protein [Xanthovirga aplysinae]|uniref:phytoene/squalene synthase family protein n=1 Tax=Xanthovirga aplysinae TaxID=2529853 RepID=UPI0012BBFC9C|nr:squalene/phytoene synthase family protein [Xanthovirga aplysinae]MTI33497.1 phytoene/squalene synthase family protein [Xanthovirga aplysinae]